MSTQEGGEGIRTSDLRFMRRLFNYCESNLISLESSFLRSLLDWVVVYVSNFSESNLVELINFSDCRTIRMIVTIYFSGTKALATFGKPPTPLPLPLFSLLPKKNKNHLFKTTFSLFSHKGQQLISLLCRINHFLLLLTIKRFTKHTLCPFLSIKLLFIKNNKNKNLDRAQIKL
jgi:hypothetical protein